jgi:hypothetical protein
MTTYWYTYYIFHASTGTGAHGTELLLPLSHAVIGRQSDQGKRGQGRIKKIWRGYKFGVTLSLHDRIFALRGELFPSRFPILFHFYIGISEINIKSYLIRGNMLRKTLVCQLRYTCVVHLVAMPMMVIGPLVLVHETGKTTCHKILTHVTAWCCFEYIDLHGCESN